MNPQAQTLAWGILGTGGIAKTFARGLAKSETGTLLAVGSRTRQDAEAFGKEFGVPRCYGSYDAVLADRDVQAIYISLPNNLHAYWTIRCAEAGKQILCEKPLATNYAEAMTAVEAAREHGVFLMEAFMYRCHPQTARLAELVRQGVIGEVRLIQAHFSFNMHGIQANVRLRNDLAGGGIMDVGCYTTSMSRLIAGAAQGQGAASSAPTTEVFANPLELHGVGHIGAESRVDEWATAAVRYPGDIVANLTTGLQVQVDNTLRIWGSEGHILVPNPWFPGEKDNKIIVHHDKENRTEEIVVESPVPLYAVEADTVARCLADKAVQAPPPCMTWADTLGNMQALDQWRRSIGLVFDNEKPAALKFNGGGSPTATPL